MRTRRLAAIFAAAAIALAGCGVQPSSVQGGGQAPTGAARGTPVYYINRSGELVVDRTSDSLGTIGQALKLLLGRSPPPGLDTYVGRSSVTLAFPVTRGKDVITIMLPIDRDDIFFEVGLDQIVCTVLAVHQQSGGSASTRVRLDFTHGPSTELRACPVLPKH